MERTLYATGTQSMVTKAAIGRPLGSMDAWRRLGRHWERTRRVTGTSGAGYAKSISNAAGDQTVPVSAPTRHWCSKGIPRRAQPFCLWVHQLWSQGKWSFCKQTECPPGKRHHLMSLGAAHLLRLLKDSLRGPQEVESVEEGERVETVNIAYRLKERERLFGLGPSLSGGQNRHPSRRFRQAVRESV
jgi:hypothetical protein